MRALEASARTIAMLGDGINDSPGLRAADVGLAIGADGTAAREVADINLEKADLSLLVEGLESARATQPNVRRSFFILGTNGPDAPALGAGLIRAALYGPQSAQARAMMFGSLVGGQLLHAMNCRSSAARKGARSPLGWIVADLLAAQAVACVLPGLRGVLGLAPIGPAAAAATVGSVAASYALSRSLGRNGGTEGGRQEDLHFIRQ